MKHFFFLCKLCYQDISQPCLISKPYDTPRFLRPQDKVTDGVVHLKMTCAMGWWPENG